MISFETKAVPRTHRKWRQRGATLLLFTFLTALVLIPLIGLAVDGAVVFWVKAKLSSAVDAAALAAGRSINVYYTQQQNSGPVATVAQQWFSANFPTGWLGTSVVGGAPTVTIQPTGMMTQQVSVAAQAVVPLYFMRLLHFNNITIAANAQSSRRNVNLVLVLDRSGSMGAAPCGSNACPIMIQDAQAFVNRFTDGFDTLSLVTFSSTANINPIDYPPNTHFKTATPTLSSVIGNIGCTGATSSAQALNVAWQTIQNTGLAGALNVIVFFTDGQPNEVVETSWPIRWNSDSRYDPLNTGTMDNPLSASTCNWGQTIAGGLTTMLVCGTSPGTTGYTGGLLDTSANVAINSAPGTVNASGCAFSNYSGYCRTQPSLCVRQDVAYIPNKDAYQNVTSSGYKGSPALFTSGLYNNQIRVDEQVPAVIAAAFNAADYQATQIRNNTIYNTIIFTIGLDGAPDMPIDQVFLERIANDPRSPTYDSSRPAGYYAYAADPSALAEAFNLIASQILRLSQ